VVVTVTVDRTVVVVVGDPMAKNRLAEIRTPAMTIAEATAR
jgi:hypothetical protein